MKAGTVSARSTVPQNCSGVAASTDKQNPVSPSVAIIGAGEEDGGEDGLEDDGAEVLELDEEVERKAAKEDKRVEAE